MRPSRIDGQRLDIVLQRIRERDPVRSIVELDEAEEYSGEGIGQKRLKLASLETQLIDFIMPLISDPSIFESRNVRMLLEGLCEDILPNLDAPAELIDLAIKLCDEELQRHEFVSENRQSGIAS